MRKQTPLEEALEKEIYVSRLLVVLECENHFHQIALSKDQFKKVSDAVAVAIEEDSKEMGGEKLEKITIRMTPAHITNTQFEGMRDFYTHEELLQMEQYSGDFENES